jgi:hypothetical protein
MWRGARSPIEPQAKPARQAFAQGLTINDQSFESKVSSIRGRSAYRGVSS